MRNRTSFLTAFAFIAAFPGSPSAGDRKAGFRPAAFRKLAAATQLYGKFLGLDGHPSPTSETFPALLKETDARRWFSLLVAEGTMAGQLYGLCGLYLTDKEAFEAVKGRFVSSNLTVTISDSCVDWSDTKVSDLFLSRADREKRNQNGQPVFAPYFSSFCESLR